jgi:RHS repeat-associated protein
MYVANTHLKPVIGIDIHFVNTPIPFIPLPHPYIGLVIDPFDYLPFIGATVKVNHVPRGNTDTGGMIITFVHIPFGIGFSLMPIIGHDSQNFFGSKTVSVDGAPMSGAGYMLMTCNDIGIPLSFRPGKKFIPIPSLYLPTSFCIPLQWGKPVMVGGPLVPNFSLMALLKAFAFGSLLKIFGKLGGKLLKALNNKLLKKFPSSKKLSSKLCKMGFEPVDLISGRVNYEYTDFELPGPIPLKWTRNWDSDSAVESQLGHGVHLCYDRCIQLWPDEGCLSVTMEDGRLVVFPLLYYGESYYHPQEKILLRRKQNGHFLLEDYDHSLYYHFNHQQQPQSWQLSFIENYSGHRIQLHYTGGYLSAITDSAGRQLLLKLDKKHRISSVEVNHRAVQQILVSYQYNDDGDMIGISDALNQSVTIEYKDHLMVKKTDRNGQNFYWEYDAQQRCVHTWGDGGILEGFIEYHKGYNLVTNSVGETTTYYFDENNLCVQETDHYGNHTYTEYTEDFDVYREIDEAGNITGYAYDERHRLKEQMDPDGSIIQYHYNEHNQVELVIFPNGSSETYGYDAMRRLTFINRANGLSLSYEYNVEGQMEAIIQKGSIKTQLVYDEDDNLCAMQLPDGTTATWKYDALGRCIQTSNAAGEVRFLEYDALSRVRTINLPNGKMIKREYNAYDEVIRETDNHTTVQYEYTPLGNVKKRIEQNKELSFLYDTEERLQTVVNEAGRRYMFDYNKRGEVIAEKGFDGLQRQFERDTTGKVIRVNRPGNRYTRYEYDANGRITRADYHDGNWCLYGYDRNGELKEASNEHGTIRFIRNKQDQLIVEEQDGYKVFSEFNKLGYRTRVHTNLGANIQFDLDKVGLPVSMQASATSHSGVQAQWQAHMKYNQTGHELERILPGDLISEWKYDQSGRAYEHKVSKRGVVQRWKKYSWVADERLTSIFDALAHANTSFKHNAAGNLIFAQYADNQKQHRAVDETGNIYETAAKTDRKYNAAGAPLETEKYLYKYDEEGNLVSKTEKATQKKTVYEWDAAGLLRKVIRPDKMAVAFTYDALGRRISKTFAGKITRWLWDDEVAIQEWTYAEQDKPIAVVNEWGDILYDKEEPNPLNTPGVKGITWVYEHEGFVPCAKIEAGQTYSIISDFLGTPAEAYNENGEKIWEAVLDIYGRANTLIGNKNFIPFRYQGQYEDVETGLYYNRFRYYSPEEGLYISQDPIGLHAGSNFYAYVPDVNFWVDVFGLIKGGSYYRVRKYNTGGEVNHFPAWASYKNSRRTMPTLPGHGSAPTVWMSYADHRQTASCGSGHGAAAWRMRQNRHIRAGNWAAAMEMDIDDIMHNFGRKYKRGLREGIGHAYKLGLITKADKTRLKAKCK